MGLITVQKNGRLRLNRDLSKWRRKQIGPKHFDYYDVHPSALERANEHAIKVELAKHLKEPSAATEALIAKADLQRESEVTV